MQAKTSDWKIAAQYGLIAGAVSVLLSLVGMVEAFDERYIIAGVLTFGQIVLWLPIVALSYFALSKISVTNKLKMAQWGALTGAIGGFVLSVLVAVGSVVDLREMFINATPGMYDLITLGVPVPAGIFVPIFVGAFMGLLGTGLQLLSPRWRKTILQASAWVMVIGLLRDLIMVVLLNWGPVAQAFTWAFAANGLTILAATILFVVVAFFTFRRYGNSAKNSWVNKLPAKQQKAVRWTAIAALILFTIFLPKILGIFFIEILDNVGIYILMGLGLNIVVGFAGLLDLGYVAFFAIGGYTIGVLTSPELGFGNLTYWQALPIALFMAVSAGVLLGLPVLRLRGDYLAIVTLGFGEIIRLLALSDWLKVYLGGTQGIQRIAQPTVGSLVLNDQQSLYYLILVFIAIAGFVAWRLKDSRVGRTWMALREDEDVSQAMGINNVLTKLMAFGTGAFFSGLAGTMFVAKLGSAYPSSFNFLVSINVLALIIVGGLGSIPGVFVGALVLMGLPELLREFADFRYMFYGAALVAMMLLRPEGLWPEARRKLELHENADMLPAVEPQQTALKNPGQ